MSIVKPAQRALGQAKVKAKAKVLVASLMQRKP